MINCIFRFYSFFFPNTVDNQFYNGPLSFSLTLSLPPRHLPHNNTDPVTIRFSCTRIEFQSNVRRNALFTYQCNNIIQHMLRWNIEDKILIVLNLNTFATLELSGFETTIIYKVIVFEILLSLNYQN